MNALKELGKNAKDGSSVDIGVPYQDIPKLGIVGNRNNTELRAKRVMELVDMQGREVLDLGCSVGTMTASFAEHASRVIGIDHDDTAISVAQGIYNSNTEFRVDSLNMAFLDTFDRTNIVVWTSQFMWMVKQYGMEYALEFLWKLSTKCDVLVFESAGQDDGSAPLNLKQTDFFELLCRNTCFKDIRDHGPWNDGWSPRNVFVCKAPFERHIGEWSTVKLGGQREIVKTFKDHPFARELKERELHCLRLLAGHKYFPHPKCADDLSITMSWEGITPRWLPEADCREILSLLKLYGITHRDIRPSNILWNGTNAVLIDFSFATIGNEVTNYHYDLGGSYKCPYGFNDEYSLERTRYDLCN